MLTHEISRVLERELGLGEFPLVRRRLFSRLQRVCEQKGDEPLLIVAQVREEARTLRDRGNGGPATQSSRARYFCKVAVLRLTEAGYWARPEGGTDPANEPPPPPPPRRPASPPVNQSQEEARCVTNFSAELARRLARREKERGA